MAGGAGQNCRLGRGRQAVLFANYTDSIADDIQAIARSDPAMWEPYRKHYSAVNVWTERCDRIFPAGSVRYSHMAIADAELKKTEFYADFLEPNEMDYGFGVEIALPDQPAALLSAFRPTRHGPFDEQQGQILLALLPHLQRALRLHFELSALRSSKQDLELALDALDRAVLGLNGKGEVLFANQTAHKLAAQPDGLGVKENRLVADGQAQNAELQFLLEQAAETGAGFSNGGAILIKRKSQKPPLRLTILPFAANLLGNIPGLATLVFVDDPAKKPLSRAATLRTLFRLSPTETRLADLLLQGMEVREASERLGVTLETTRFHLKQIFAKTGVRRQTELIRLMLSLPGSVGSKIAIQKSCTVVQPREDTVRGRCIGVRREINIYG